MRDPSSRPLLGAAYFVPGAYKVVMGPRPGSRKYRRKVLAALGPAVFVLALASAAVAADPPSLSVSDPSVTEGDSGTRNLSYVVSLSPASTDTVTVAYGTADNSAAEPADYARGGGIARVRS